MIISIKKVRRYIIWNLMISIKHCLLICALKLSSWDLILLAWKIVKGNFDLYFRIFLLCYVWGEGWDCRVYGIKCYICLFIWCFILRISQDESLLKPSTSCLSQLDSISNDGEIVESRTRTRIWTKFKFKFNFKYSRIK